MHIASASANASVVMFSLPGAGLGFHGNRVKLLILLATVSTEYTNLLGATRVNDYNPLRLMLWKANIDIQFVAESSLALSGYVTKAERSSMQEIWQEVSENKSIYSRLWSFGVRSLRFRECGLYEASDLLLGDHLTEKSATVKWIDVSMPHKRNRTLKDHKELRAHL